MRTEREMLSLIETFAQSDERIRAVWLNGSRANPNAAKDVFMDFDVVCAATEIAPFVRDKSFIRRFGDVAVMQEPDAAAWRGRERGERYAYLMQFTDINRIDLTFLRLDVALKEYGSDSQTLPLIDKDGALPKIPPPSDKTYRVQKPTAEEFSECMNEFRWVAPYVAKGIKRKEPTYAQEMLNGCVRKELIRMLSWKAAIPFRFEISAGKCGKYLHKYMSEKDYEALLSTYCGAGEEEMWRALAAAFGLFLSASSAVAEALGYPKEEREMRASFDYILYLKTV